MKKLFGLLAILFLSSLVFGHPPESVKMSFDSTGTVLSVIINHPVKTITNHYISSVIVDVNGKERIKQSFSSQFDSKEQVALYMIFDLKKGDKINVTAQCNITGKKKETIIYSFE